MTSEKTPITGATYGEEQARDRTRAFLLEQAEKPTSEILAAVDAALTRFAESLEGVTAEQAAYEPGGEGEDAFSITQVARHVAGSSVIMASRLGATARGEPLAPATGPGSFGSVEASSIRELITAILPARAALSEGEAAIRKDPRAGVIKHPAFGDLDCASYLRMIGLHIEDHVHQVAKIKADRGYPPAG